MNKQHPTRLTIIIAISLLLAACGGPARTADVPSIAEVVPTEPIPDPQPTVEAEIAEPAEPAQVGNLADQFTAPVTAEGELLIITGRILDVTGSPVPDARIEFWQTDTGGSYDHPGDSTTDSRDLGFQFYGSSSVDQDGTYLFRTILPGQYEPRPRHIHVKVFQAEQEVLTTQFYFAEDDPTGGIGGPIDNLMLQLDPIEASDGTTYSLSTFDVVVDTAGSDGTLPLTDAQGEGPFYPVVDVSTFDNDLASTEG